MAPMVHACGRCHSCRRSEPMTIVDREIPVSTARPADARSPFVRLAELLAPHQPGQPAINLSVGEPQHAVPSFVGPVLAAQISDFNRYPANPGTDRFRAAW